ncbi:signal transduction histidine kinase [Streptosporangium album]|uniref:histidine kinase n=1 Tax=Streptosporangium album TaxID=47479 RepID=A0A7W7S4E4_9ACTN|nr:histidine kinase [Streptosporangium album]MBB4943701.1 signal transduction histidine kinase [Streptosporangium album]
MNLPAGLVRLTRPLALAVVSGKADPPFPRSRGLRIPIPASLGLLPFRTVDLVVVANLLIFWFAYSGNLSAFLENNGAPPAPYPEWQIYYAVAACALPLLLREHWPLAAWRISAVAMVTTAPLTDTLLGNPVPVIGILTYLLVVYSVAVRCERDTTLGVWIASVLCMAISPSSRDEIVIAAILLGVTALFGYNVRTRRLATRRLAEEEQRSEQALAGQAVLEERARIARELHDVVAHHMSVIAIQAEAVPLQAAGDARRLEEGLGEIRALSLTAMTEMRRVLGVLRDGDGLTETAPQPGLGRLEELIATARSAGLAVTLKLGGDLTGLPTAVSLSAYRIVQESTSNAMRHAPGSTVLVKINRSGAELHINVTNDAGYRSPTEPGHIGHGLIGMRERVSMLGGRLWAGPVGTGFAITAILPIVEAT